MADIPENPITQLVTQKRARFEEYERHRIEHGYPVQPVFDAVFRLEQEATAHRRNTEKEAKDVEVCNTYVQQLADAILIGLYHVVVKTDDVCDEGFCRFQEHAAAVGWRVIAREYKYEVVEKYEIGCPKPHKKDKQSILVTFRKEPTA